MPTTPASPPRAHSRPPSPRSPYTPASSSDSGPPASPARTTSLDRHPQPQAGARAPTPSQAARPRKVPPADGDAAGAMPTTTADTAVLPSPPLTRVGTNDSVRRRAALDAARAVREADLATWDREELDEGPTVLSQGQGTTLADDDDAGGEVDVADLSAASDSHSHHPAKGSTPPSPRAWTDEHPLRKLPSPQPWDLTDPGRTGRSRGGTSYDGDSYSMTKLNRVAFRGTQPSSSSKPRIPHSSYYFGPPAADSAYGTDPVGQIGVHHPREIIRIERDYSGGELPQFSTSYPLELEGRITPTQFLETINSVNELLISAHSLSWSCIDNTFAVLSLYLSRFLFTSHYDKELRRIQKLIRELNAELYNPMGLNLLWPRDNAFLFLEIEYY